MKEPTEKQARALELRRAGWTWTRIGNELGTTESNARQWAERAILKEKRLEKLEGRTHELREDQT
jgi:transcriptional regulator